MRVIEIEGGFAFLFDHSEKSLGLGILEGFKANSQQAIDQIIEAKLIVLFAGEDTPKSIN